MTTLQSIKNNISNKTFFDASTFHDDKHYYIITTPKQNYFVVSAGFKGMRKSAYKLNGSRIGNYVDLSEIKL